MNQASPYVGIGGLAAALVLIASSMLNRAGIQPLQPDEIVAYTAVATALLRGGHVLFLWWARRTYADIPDALADDSKGP